MSKNSKEFIFVSGLPRSGSSLFCNILNQRNDSYASPTSGVNEIVRSILQGWNNVPEFKANSNDDYKVDMVRGIMEGYYTQHDVKYVFEKSRGWPGQIEELEKIFGKKPKIILCVRDVRDILSSWEKMFRRDKKNLKITPGDNKNMINISSRCEGWSSAGSPLGSAFNVMRDAVDRGFTDCMYLFEYEKWTHNPQVEFKKLYKWLGIEPYMHDFNNIKQVLHENDEHYGYTDLHTIHEGALKPSEPQWPRILGAENAAKYEGSNIWKDGKFT